jgi:hypothetical protein
MKKLIYSISILSMVMIAGGCKKFLTQPPMTTFPTYQFFKSLKDINAALAGIYASMQQDLTVMAAI